MAQLTNIQTRIEAPEVAQSFEEVNEQLRKAYDYIAILNKQLNWVINGGFLASDNIKEISGWEVGPQKLESVDGTVGMSTEGTAGTSVRFWAGSTDPDTAPWRVTKDGKMTATGATIQSQSGYPRVEMDPSGNLFAAYLDADNYIKIEADYGGSPSVNFFQGGNLRGRIDTVPGALEIISASSNGIIINGITGGTDFDGNVTFDSWNTVKKTGGTTLQQELDQKATFNAQTGSSGSGTFNGGIPIGTVLQVSGGGTVTWAGISIPSHTHTQT